MYELPSSVIAEEIEKIVLAQSPIHIMLLCKQLAPLYSNTKVTNKVTNSKTPINAI